MQKLLLGLNELNELIYVKHVVSGQKIFAVSMVRRASAFESPYLPPCTKPGPHFLASEILQ